MSKVELAKIRALTFYNDRVTAYRRTHALPQLVCAGKPCKIYQPEVVRCENIGGSGVEIDWKCEADLPEALRFGKVEVSCEGFSKPGDPYVLKGSCSLEYRLVQVPGSLLKTDDPRFAPGYSWAAILFYALFLAVLGFIIFKFVSSRLGNNNTSNGTRPSHNRPPPGGWGPSWYSGFNQRRDPGDGPPPPYSKNPDPNASTAQGWRPGFWTGAALGGLANEIWTRQTDRREPAPRQYDWEQPQARRPLRETASWSSPARQSYSDDRGEGSSNLGSMRRSTGIGGSNVR